MNDTHKTAKIKWAYQGRDRSRRLVGIITCAKYSFDRSRDFQPAGS
jgi:hypothetical protein